MIRQLLKTLFSIIVIATLTSLSSVADTAKKVGEITVKVGEKKFVFLPDATYDILVGSTAYLNSIRWSISSDDWNSLALYDTTDLTCRIEGLREATNIKLSYKGNCILSGGFLWDYCGYYLVNVVPDIKIEELSLSPTSVTLNRGVGKPLTTEITPSNASNKSLEWSSDNTSVATVSSNGYVTAVSKGNATITCRTKDGSNLQATCYVSVTAGDEYGNFTSITSEGVEMNFYVISEDEKICGAGGNWTHHLCVDKNTTGKITIPKTADGYRVVEIGNDAFFQCKSITAVDIPSSVFCIGSSAFSRCESLSQIIGLDNNVEYIGPSAFEGTIWNDNLPEGALYIGKVFVQYKGKMPNNMTFKVDEGTKSICDYALSWGANEGLVELEIPASVTQIGDRRMYWNEEENKYSGGANGGTLSPIKYCPNLKTIVIDIGNDFYDSRNNCNAIIETNTNALIAGCNTTVIPPTVKTICDNAFYYLSDINSIRIPDQVEQIGGKAITGCSNLESVIIGERVKMIGDIRNKNSGGSNNRCLKAISVHPDNPYFDSRENCNAVIEKATSCLRLGCSSTIIPSTVKEIGNGAFNANGSNDFPSTFIIPDNVEKINKFAFYDQSNLENLVIGKGVNEIGSWAFGGHTDTNKLMIIYVLREFPFEIPDNVFVSNTYEKGTLYVPQGSSLNYKSTNGWKEFKNIVEFDATTFNPSSLIVDVTDIELNHTSLKMKINESMQLNATPKPDNATRKSVNWISSDEAIVSVNSSGVVTANAAGSASIYCMAVDNSGVVVTCTVDVEGNPTIVKNNSQEKGIVDIFYNLSGQRLTAPCQGINIVNGKKVVIK